MPEHEPPYITVTVKHCISDQTDQHPVTTQNTWYQEDMDHHATENDDNPQTTPQTTAVNTTCSTGSVNDRHRTHHHGYQHNARQHEMPLNYKQLQETGYQPCAWPTQENMQEHENNTQKPRTPPSVAKPNIPDSILDNMSRQSNNNMSRQSNNNMSIQSNNNMSLQSNNNMSRQSNNNGNIRHQASNQPHRNYNQQCIFTDL
jgi:hypothetical protein